MPAAWIIVTSAAFMFLGLLGVVVPALPGLGLIFVGILIYAAATEFTVVAPLTVIILGVLALLGWLADLLGSLWGARIGGGRKEALIGTIAGTIAGLFIGGPPGLLIGAFTGAFLGALFSGDKQDKALRVALSSVLGILGGAVMQLVLGVIMILAFIIALFV